MEANSLKASWTVDGYCNEGMQAVKIVNWKRCAQDRNRWKSAVEQAETQIEL
jgi:hypothetical protein